MRREEFKHRVSKKCQSLTIALEWAAYHLDKLLSLKDKVNMAQMSQLCGCSTFLMLQRNQKERERERTRDLWAYSANPPRHSCGIFEARKSRTQEALGLS